MRLSNVLSCIKNAIRPAMKLKETEISIDAPWGKIATITWGEPSNPPIILCHGKQDVCTGFRPLVSRLPTSFFYVSVDLPGNGKSDQFPKGSRFTVVDFVPTISAVKDHFKWDKFAYIGHSLGVLIGKYYNVAHPGDITRMVELEPVPAYETWAADSFGHWYHQFYGNYYTDKYSRYNAGPESAPKYTYEKALWLMINARGLTKEAAVHVLERALEPAGDGLFRFTFDQRQKEIPRMPLSSEYMRQVYTSPNTPTFGILAQSMIDAGIYRMVPFVKDESAWPNKNYRVKIVTGSHDVHINDPDCMAEDVSKFLLEDFKAKL